MRELKFRVWSSIDNEMSEPFTLAEVMENEPVAVDENFETVMQFTGIKDKNGEHEIYEHDVLMDEQKEQYEVIWEECGFVARTENEMFDLQTLASKTVVAGNIYQNPELIN